ncbi:heavy metal-associated domain-containing protein [Aquimarina sp. AU474]|uniref:heavy metal translocating P-type ATPase n=1 Tax=Aquimarina sp. AU474 TaxID=2108529 RepID=UPI000D6999A5|nr:heavy metal-associated domain-containing protein [Aquimarina sp. AU474]
MKHIYTVSGMTCGGCRNSVEQKLGELEDVINVSVSLEEAEAIIETKSNISLKKLQEILPSKYVISQKRGDISLDSKKTKLQELRPLFLIFGYILVASVLLNYKDWNQEEFMLDFMGLFYIIFSFFKILDLKGFSQSFSMYDPLARVSSVYAWVYPFIELGLALLFLVRFQISIALIVTVIILGITTYGVVRILLNKKSIECACLGTVLKLPMTEATFIENIIMICMAIIMLTQIF